MAIVGANLGQAGAEVDRGSLFNPLLSPVWDKLDGFIRGLQQPQLFEFF